MSDKYRIIERFGTSRPFKVETKVLWWWQQIGDYHTLLDAQAGVAKEIKQDEAPRIHPLLGEEYPNE